MARKATTSTTTRATKPKSAAKTAKSKAASAKSGGKSVSAKATSAKKVSGVKRTTARATRSLAVLQPEMFVLDNGGTEQDDVVVAETPSPTPSDFQARTLFGEAQHYDVTFNGGMRSVSANTALIMQAGNGPTIKIAIAGDIADEIEAATGSPLNRFVYLFQDSIAGRIEVEQRSTGLWAYIGMPAAQFHPMHYLLQTEKRVKCRVSADVAGGELSLRGADIYVYSQEIGERSN